MLRRFFGNLILGIVLSILGAIIMAAIGLIANLPRIIQGAIWLIRQALRLFYQLYALMLSSLQPPIYDLTGLDLLSPTARTITSLALSMSLGTSILWLLNWQIGLWWLMIFAIHGLTVGYFWDQLLHPGEFNLGNPVE